MYITTIMMRRLSDNRLSIYLFSILRDKNDEKRRCFEKYSNIWENTKKRGEPRPPVQLGHFDGESEVVSLTRKQKRFRIVFWNTKKTKYVVFSLRFTRCLGNRITRHTSTNLRTSIVFCTTKCLQVTDTCCTNAIPDWNERGRLISISVRVYDKKKTAFVRLARRPQDNDARVRYRVGRAEDFIVRARRLSANDKPNGPRTSLSPNAHESRTSALDTRPG